MDRMRHRIALATWVALVGGGLGGAALGAEPELERAFVFSAHSVDCATANRPDVNYTLVHHSANNSTVADALEYDAGRGWGYEAIDPGNTALNGFARFGPFDDSPNTRNIWPDTCPVQLYDSFIGCKNFSSTCQDLVDPDMTCEGLGLLPEGAIFRVDVPNGTYRFIAVVGSPDNAHSSRILAEDGGSGPPDMIGVDFVVLVNNFDAALFPPASGVGQSMARVAFGCFGPPAADGPTFVNMDDEGFATDPGLDGVYGTADDGPADSPELEVTQGYIRIHQLQGNASSDVNGGNMVLLELWRVESGDDVGNGRFIDVTRTFVVEDPSGQHAPGESIDVELDVSGVTDSATIVETVPEGWVIEDDGGGDVTGSTITFDITSDTLITYSVRAPLTCEPSTFSAEASPDGGCASTIVSEIFCKPAECGLQFNGAISEMLVIGPIDLEDPLAPGAVPGANCDDDGRLGTTDYLTDADGDLTEANILADVGTEVAPDFGGLAGGYGVKAAANPFINPLGFDGILTAWRADADPNGYVNFVDADNIGDPVDDYLVYSIAYLENTTGDCVDAVLEVGSDDAIKVRVNGVLVHVNAICRGIPALGAGDRVPATLQPGVNVVLIAVVERGGGNGVSLVVRNPDDTPLVDGRVVATCEPPDAYPEGAVGASRSLGGSSAKVGDEVAVTLQPLGVTAETTIVETLPEGVAVVDAGGGTVAGTEITFTVADDEPITYRIRVGEVAGTCPFEFGEFAGTVSAPGSCETTVGGDSSLACVQPPCPATPESSEAELEIALIFGSRDLACPVFNQPDVNYEVVHHPDNTVALDLEYSPERGWGYDPIYPDPLDQPYGDRNGFGIFGPFDDSPNGRGSLPDTCPEQIYDSFIGAKDFLTPCDELIVNPPDGNVPCDQGDFADVPEGIIFRIDVPNGRYRFVAAVGESENPHAHRLLAENGGEGPPEDISDEHVVLVSNFDQAQYEVGEVDAAEPGQGVYARVGFGDKSPPPGDGVAPDPMFVNMDEEGIATDPGDDLIHGTADDACAESPVLEVTEGYIRIHQLQGNSNTGPGGPRDPNGGDLVLLELWRIPDGDPSPKFVRGDADASGAINITDGIFILNFLFLGGPDPSCRDAADADDSGAINITDGIYILNFLFLGGPDPAEPTDACGSDPTEDDLDCEAFTPCP